MAGKAVWTKELLIKRGRELYSVLGRGFKVAEITEAAKISNQTILRYFGGLAAYHEACGIKDKSTELDLSVLRAERAAQTSESVFKQENRLLHAEVDRLEAERDTLRGLREPVVPGVLRLKRSKGPKPRVLGGPVLASDWHLGGYVNPAIVNGMNCFNAEIAEESAYTFFRKLLTLIKIERSAALIDYLLLWLGGDFISNTIHEDLAESNTMSPVEEVRFAKRVLIEGLTFLLKEGDFEKITLPCSFGNHGRTTDKRRIQTAGENSYERMLYQDLQDWFDAKGERRLDWRIAAGEHVYVEVEAQGGAPFVFDFFHGDSIKGGMGVGGLAVPVGRRILKLEKQRHADLRCFGHFHEMGWDAGHLRNGSLIGFDAFAESIGAALTPPCQAFSTFNPERRAIDAIKPIWVRGDKA